MSETILAKAKAAIIADMKPAVFLGEKILLCRETSSRTQEATGKADMLCYGRADDNLKGMPVDKLMWSGIVKAFEGQENSEDYKSFLADPVDRYDQQIRTMRLSIFGYARIAMRLHNLDGTPIYSNNDELNDIITVLENDAAQFESLINVANLFNPKKDEPESPK